MCSGGVPRHDDRRQRADAVRRQELPLFPRRPIALGPRAHRRRVHRRIEGGLAKGPSRRIPRLRLRGLLRARARATRRALSARLAPLQPHALPAHRERAAQRLGRHLGRRARAILDKRALLCGEQRDVLNLAVRVKDVVQLLARDACEGAATRTNGARGRAGDE